MVGSKSGTELGGLIEGATVVGRIRIRQSRSTEQGQQREVRRRLPRYRRSPTDPTCQRTRAAEESTIRPFTRKSVASKDWQP